MLFGFLKTKNIYTQIKMLYYLEVKKENWKTERGINELVQNLQISWNPPTSMLEIILLNTQAI